MWFQTLVLDVKFEDLEYKAKNCSKDKRREGFSVILYDYDGDDEKELIGRTYV